MEWLIGLVVVVVGCVVVARHNERARGKAGAQRFSVSREDGDCEWTFACDFPSMSATTSRVLRDEVNEYAYELRRDDGPAWFMRLTPDSRERRRQELEEDVASSMVPGLVEQSRQELASLGEWEPISRDGDGRQLEAAYQVYLHTRG